MPFKLSLYACLVFDQLSSYNGHNMKWSEGWAIKHCWNHHFSITALITTILSASVLTWISCCFLASEGIAASHTPAHLFILWWYKRMDTIDADEEKKSELTSSCVHIYRCWLGHVHRLEMTVNPYQLSPWIHSLFQYFYCFGIWWMNTESKILAHLDNSLFFFLACYFSFFSCSFSSIPSALSVGIWPLLKSPKEYPTNAFPNNMAVRIVKTPLKP